MSANESRSGCEDGETTPSRRRRRSSSSSSSESEHSRSQVKRSRQGESENLSLQDLSVQVSTLTHMLWQKFFNQSDSQSQGAQPSNVLPAGPEPGTSTRQLSNNHSGSIAEPPTCQEVIPAPGAQSIISLNRPALTDLNCEVDTPRFNLSLINTAVKDPKIPNADPVRVKQVEALQHFNDPKWRDVRYADVLKLYNATPGFSDLGINDELRQFIKGRDHIANSERLVAALSNALLEQREMLNRSLQQFVDWAASSNTVLTASNVFDKIAELFQPNTSFHKTSEAIMQLVCGKRAEFIENRRERILSELPNKNLREGLRKIPPSSKHLFNETQLQTYIQNTGGLDKWVRPWFNLDKRQVTQNPQSTNKPNKSSARERPFRSHGQESLNKKGKFSAPPIRQTTKFKNSSKKEVRPNKPQ